MDQWRLDLSEAQVAAAALDDDETMPEPSMKDIHAVYDVNDIAAAPISCESKRNMTFFTKHTASNRTSSNSGLYLFDCSLEVITIFMMVINLVLVFC